MFKPDRSSIVTILLLTAFLAGCAASSPPVRPSTYFPELLSRFTPTADPLHFEKISSATVSAMKEYEGPRDAVIFVHPAYSHFFRDLDKDARSPEKFKLQKKQFEHEYAAIRSQVLAGSVTVLVLPGKYLDDSTAPRSYVSYLNSATAGGHYVYYVLSEASSTGRLPVDDMVNLYLFLQAMGARKVLIGGGFIGRCQREFYNQLTTYIEPSLAYIVPELSTISPDDLSEDEAAAVDAGLDRNDYAPVKAFIDKRTGGSVNILSMPATGDY